MKPINELLEEIARHGVDAYSDGWWVSSNGARDLPPELREEVSRRRNEIAVETRKSAPTWQHRTSSRPERAK